MQQHQPQELQPSGEAEQDERRRRRQQQLAASASLDSGMAPDDGEDDDDEDDAAAARGFPSSLLQSSCRCRLHLLCRSQDPTLLPLTNAPP